MSGVNITLNQLELGPGSDYHVITRIDGQPYYRLFGGRLFIEETIQDRDSNTLYSDGDLVYVKDASGDPNVQSGFGLYGLISGSWVKIQDGSIVANSAPPSSDPENLIGIGSDGKHLLTVNDILQSIGALPLSQNIGTH